MDMLVDADITVRLVLALLLLFSVVSWAIILAKLIQVRRANRASARFLDLFWKAERFAAIAARVETHAHSPLTTLFKEGYAELQRVDRQGIGATSGSDPSTDLGGVENVGRALRRAANAEVTRLEQHLTFLATTGSTAPFVGLFGTVWGIMTAFAGIGRSGNASLAVVAPGISEALIATAIGLVAAIPAVMAYNHFQQKIRVLANDMDCFATEFLNIVQRNVVGR